MDFLNRAISLRSTLALLVLACSLPMIVFIVGALSLEVGREHERMLDTELATTRSVSALVDREIASVVSALSTLRHSAHLQSLDFLKFHEQSTKVLEDLPPARNIYLTDAEGNMLTNTSRPFTTGLPKTGNLALIEAVVSSGKTQVSDTFKGALSGQVLVSVGVPVFDKAKRVRFVLLASLNASQLAALLRNEQIVPVNWIASIHDRTGRFIARSKDHERFHGQLASKDLLAAMAARREGTLEGVTREGIQVVAAYSPSQTSGWTVAVGVPKADLLAELRRAIMLAIVGIGGTLLIGFYAAHVLLKRIRTAVAQIRPQAQRLINAEVFQALNGPIVELNDLSRALADASRVLSEAKHRSQHDSLTGLANRDLLLEILDMQLAVARRTETSVALLYIDLDGFKAVNDSLGHQAGDELLHELAQRIRSLIRASDCAARLGGDEFCVILADTDAIGAKTLAEKLLVALLEPVHSGIGDMRVSASIGIALYPYHAQNSVDLVFKADEAMYRAKQAGKNRFHLQMGQL
jgi:diguanylate cyclase (GGDEF)-like protein